MLYLPSVENPVSLQMVMYGNAALYKQYQSSTHKLITHYKC